MNDEYNLITEDVLTLPLPLKYEARDEYVSADTEKIETETGNGPVEGLYLEPLSSDLDIFDNLPVERLSEMPRVINFLKELRYSILENAENLKGVYYNKLSLEASSQPGELMIDWIFNYFRAFFSFDDKEGDMYGLIVNNTETNQFKSEFQPLKESDYNAVAAKSIRFITENLRR